MALGLSPEALPSHDIAFDGKVLTIANSTMWQVLAETLWSGKSVSSMSCDSGAFRTPVISNDMIGPGRYFYAQPYMATMEEIVLLDGEAPLHLDLDQKEPYFVIDYRTPIEEYCPRTDTDEALDGLNTTDLYLARTYPFNGIIDLIRVVNHTDQGIIFLGRTLLPDWRTGVYSTIAYFSLESDSWPDAPFFDMATRTVPVTFDHTQHGFSNQLAVLMGVNHPNDAPYEGPDGTPLSPWTVESMKRLVTNSMKDVFDKIRRPFTS